MVDEPKRGKSVSRRSLIAVAGGVGVVGAGGYAAWKLSGDATESDGSEDPEKPNPNTTEPSSFSVEEREAWVDSVIQEMDLETKVGQLFMVYVHGDAADTANGAFTSANQQRYGVNNAAELIASYRVGGIIYFDWADNVSDPAQIARLSAGIQQASFDELGIHALIGVDQEHGAVTRIGRPATYLPPAMAIGATQDVDVAKEAAYINGSELRAMGINVNFAPVADVNVNPNNPVIGRRSFSADPEVAAEMVAGQVEGYATFGESVSACAKHFPGHGDTDVDSHVGLPVITHSEEEWRSIDRPPFAAAVEADIDMVMSAHLEFPALDDSNTPATLSEPILTGLMREELGYEGVISTDALDMEGVRVQHSDAEIPVLALQAGADLLLMPNDLETAYNAVVTAANDGTISEERIDQSVRRLLRLRYHRGLTGEPLSTDEAVATAEETVGSDSNGEAAQALFDKTVTVVDGGGILPAATGGSVAVFGPSDAVVNNIVSALESDGMSASGTVTGDSPTWQSISNAASTAGNADFAVVLCADAMAGGNQIELVTSVNSSGTPTAAVSMAKPYDVANFPQGVVSMATYSQVAEAMASVSGIVTGRLEASASLPVDL
ncbi:glycoside hydrolase family 3 protein [Haloglycomyces albus]|uniref:glycoside hydrolase family 3 protein n=1 Tax=Haloglycomyces albus TaxID=526067 RepID=UPI00046CA836|nr:glycoside hydrolase family 3 protein [Haloglycomyces albus]